jgi:hypothetical protein
MQNKKLGIAQNVDLKNACENIFKLVSEFVF